MLKQTKINPEDFKLLLSLLRCEVARNERNPTTYYSNLVRRAIEIVSENVSEEAPPVESERRFSFYS